MCRRSDAVLLAAVGGPMGRSVSQSTPEEGCSPYVKELGCSPPCARSSFSYACRFHQPQAGSSQRRRYDSGPRVDGWSVLRQAQTSWRTTRGRRAVDSMVYRTGDRAYRSSRFRTGQDKEEETHLPVDKANVWNRPDFGVLSPLKLPGNIRCRTGAHAGRLLFPCDYPESEIPRCSCNGEHLRDI